MTNEDLKAIVEKLIINAQLTEKNILLYAQKQYEAQERHREAQEQHREAQKRQREAQDRIDEELKQLAIRMNQTDEEIKQLAVRMNQTDEQMKRTDEQMKRTDEQMKRTDEQMKRTDEKLERIGMMLGNIGNNQGDVAEEFFFQSLLKDNRLGDIYFDDITKNMYKQRGNLQEEYDLVMTNGDTIGIVETKYKAHDGDLAKLERKMKNFKKLFPFFSNYKIYGGLASFHINDEIKRMALTQGFFVLQRYGDVVHTDCGEHLLIY